MARLRGDVVVLVAGILLLALPTYGSALYSSRDDVQVIGGKDFKKEVLDFPGVVIAEFYAPWCSHCKNLMPEFKKAATALQGLAKVVAIDATVDQELASRYGVSGFPTIKLFAEDKNKPTDYNGGRTANAIVETLLRASKSLALSRLGGKRQRQRQSAGSSSSSSSNDNVIELTDDNFDEQVLAKKNSLLLVAFTAPWCGHCKKLLPEWEEAAKQLKGTVHFATVDATVHQQIAGRFGVQGYPTIKVFPPGEGRDAEAKTYQRERSANAIMAYALDVLEKSGWEPDVDELLTDKQFKEACGEDQKICVLAFLPDIRDSGKEGRNSLIQMMKRIAKSARGASYSFLWVAASKHHELEDLLELRAGFPTVAVINMQKRIYSVHTQAFSEKNVAAFVAAKGARSVRVSVRVKKVGQWPKLGSVSAWDGEEPPAIEEEFSLEDIMGDDE